MGPQALICGLEAQTSNEQLAQLLWFAGNLQRQQRLRYYQSILNLRQHLWCILPLRGAELQLTRSIHCWSSGVLCTFRDGGCPVNAEKRGHRLNEPSGCSKMAVLHSIKAGLDVKRRPHSVPFSPSTKAKDRPGPTQHRRRSGAVGRNIGSPPTCRCRRRSYNNRTRGPAARKWRL